MRTRGEDGPTKTVDVCGGSVVLGQVLNQPRKLFEAGKLFFDIDRLRDVRYNKNGSLFQDQVTSK